MKTSFSLFLLLALSILSFSQEEKELLKKVSSWAEVLQQAQKENKLIFVDTYFTGCHPCAQMDREVFPNEMISKELKDNFVGIKIDVFEEKLGDSIIMKYGISGFPTFLILNKDGKMISMFGGYNDPGRLMAELDNAKQKAAEKEFLSGFAVAFEDYPEFYKKVYDRKNRKVDPVSASAWIKQQEDWTSEEVALPILRMGKLSPEIDDYLLKNYSRYKALYGEALVVEKASTILAGQMRDAVGRQTNEAAFQKFMASNVSAFPAEDWKVLRFLLGYAYYGGIAKDTTAMLQFINQDAIVYKNYFGSLYNNMLVRKQLTPANLKLLSTWVDKGVTEEAPISIIRTAAYIHKQNNNMEGYRRFVNMGIDQSKKYKMPTASFEKMLASQ